jgi:AcrR family transcriptional regulator
MPIPARILRAFVDDLPGARHRPSQKELEREDRLIAAATTLMARFGAGRLTMSAFALATRMSVATIRRSFPDMESLLAEILFRHLRAITQAIGDATRADGASTMHPMAARRAAYIAATRTPFNAPTEAHLLLVRERHILPEDLSGTVEQLRLGIGDMIAGNHGEIALSLLDTPYLLAPQIEAMLATLETLPAEQPAATPAKAPTPPQPAFHHPAIQAAPAKPTPITPDFHTPKSRHGPH